MISKAAYHRSETQKKRSYIQRMVIVHGVLFACLLLIFARLIDIQIIRSSAYVAAAAERHRSRGEIEIQARRGEIYALNSKSGETTVLATNTTLDLLYVDPVSVDDAQKIADSLSDVLVTPDVHASCSIAGDDCPRELQQYYRGLFDPLAVIRTTYSGSGRALSVPGASLVVDPSHPPFPLPTISQVRQEFAVDIRRRIAQKKVTFIPLQYSASKSQMASIASLHITGVYVDDEQRLIYANPEEITQSRRAIARSIAPILAQDADLLEGNLQQRDLRYVPIMRRIPPHVSLEIKQRILTSMRATAAERVKVRSRLEKEAIKDPLRGIALIPEHWRYYTDPTVASQLVGFMNVNQEAQYGIERTFDSQLKGRAGRISSVTDREGGQIVTSDQRIEDPEDGDSIVLTIDPFIQRAAESIMDRALKQYIANQAQLIVMEPDTGKILAMVNAPLFNRNAYVDVYKKEPLLLTTDQERTVAVEVYDPVTNLRVFNGFIPDVFTVPGRSLLSEKLRQTLDDLERQHDLRDLSRYFIYKGQSVRFEVFPTDIPGAWLKYRNNVGVGAYLNRTIQEIYEPGSVMKPITMAIALDNKEIVPDDTYLDSGTVKKDTYEIDNNDHHHYGRVTMTNCLEFSINTCMTHVADRLGSKLFHHVLERFGFGRNTGIELEDEITGDLSHWRSWSETQLATTSFGQGIAASPLQMITALSALANGGTLMRPHIVERIIRSDGTVDIVEPQIVDRVITPFTSETITAMLVSSTERGFARAGKVDGYRIAGKTGTSQIARGGGWETGTGSTVASYMGYAPVSHPRFIVLVKLDRPQSYARHGATAAAPIFKQMAAFLFKYYGIPPDDL